MKNFIKEYGPFAIVGLTIVQDSIDDRIEDVRKQIAEAGGPTGQGAEINLTRVGRKNVSSEPSGVETAAPRRKRDLNPAARKRISAAQKKRWEAHRRNKAKK